MDDKNASDEARGRGTTTLRARALVCAAWCTLFAASCGGTPSPAAAPASAAAPLPTAASVPAAAAAPADDDEADATCNDTSEPPLPRDWTKAPAIVEIGGRGDTRPIYAMGDIHGDPVAEMATLKSAGLVGDDGKWTGGDAFLVVTGDVVDKGSASLQAIDNLIAIQDSAPAGHVVVTLGNHEMGFLADWKNSKAKALRREMESRVPKLDPRDVASCKTKYGEWLCARPLAAAAGEWFLSHAGDARTREGRDRSLAELGDWFMKRWSQRRLCDIASARVLDARKNWWGESEAPIKGVLAALRPESPVRHMVYGHQPGKIPCPVGDNRPKLALATCYGGLVFFEDVGMSSALDDKYGSEPRGGLLLIERAPKKKVTAIHRTGARQVIWSAP